jgi:hypothetical protein
MPAPPQTAHPRVLDHEGHAAGRRRPVLIERGIQAAMAEIKAARPRLHQPARIAPRPCFGQRAQVRIPKAHLLAQVFDLGEARVEQGACIRGEWCVHGPKDCGFRITPQSGRRLRCSADAAPPATATRPPQLNGGSPVLAFR